MKMSTISEVLFIYSWLLAILNHESEFMRLRIGLISTKCISLTDFFFFLNFYILWRINILASHYCFINKGLVLFRLCLAGRCLLFFLFFSICDQVLSKMQVICPWFFTGKTRTLSTNFCFRWHIISCAREVRPTTLPSGHVLILL